MSVILAACLVLLQCSVALAECDLNITSPLKAHTIPNSLKYFAGSFADVWVSKHLAESLNCSYSDTDENGNTNHSVLYKDGRGYSASGKLWEDDGIIKIKVELFLTTGLIFPLYVSHEVIGYYSCYPNVPGPGASVISVRRDAMLNPKTIELAYNAKLAFRNLQELGIPVNDGVDYNAA